MIRQLLAIAGFDLRLALRRISTWVYFGMLFVLGFFVMASSGGAWDALDSGGGGRLANSAMEIANNLSALTFLTLPITAALFGNAAVRDYQTRTYTLFFTAPISRGAYLGGRYLAALAVNLLILAGGGLGQVVATGLPTMRPERMGPFLPDAYLQAYLYLILPSLLFTGALLYSLAVATRQMLPNYIGGVALLIGYTIAQSQLSDLENREMAALLDPMGSAPASVTSRYWTVAERNLSAYPYDQLFWTNRAIWLGVALLVLGVLAWRFRFSHAAAERGARRSRQAEREAPGEALRPIELPRAHLHYGWRAQWVQLASTARREFWAIVRSVYFAALTLIGLIFAVFMATQIGEVYDTNTYPVTYSVLETVGGGFILFIIIIITFYAGELVWAERELRVSQLHDATPVPSWVPFTAKLAALVGVVFVLQMLVAAVGVATQLAYGYTNFELNVYFTELFVRGFATFVLFAVLAMTIQVVVNHKYLGHFLMILFFVVVPIVHLRAGWDHVLYNFGAGGETLYSDMNRYGASWAPWAWTNLYWGAFALLLAILSSLLWVRGEEAGTAWRMRILRARISRPVRVLATVACLLLVFTGGFVFYNTNVLNEYHSGKAGERMQAEYEKRYSRYQDIAQPRIAGVSVEVDIYPSGQDLRARGTYRLVNRTAGPIDSVHVNYPASATGKSFEFDRDAEALVSDDDYGYYIYRLATPLAAGDSMRFSWSIAYESEGFANSVSNGGAIHNGTFINNGAFPTIGYVSDGELLDDDTRRRYDLPPQDSEPPPDDPKGLLNPDIATDADWVDFSATVSTDVDQVAMAPGYLQREWVEGERRFFHYEMDAPILNFYSFLSGRYAVKRADWEGVAIEIYHHPEHEYNLDRMVRAAQASLDYYTSSYGPYPHRQLRIVEFPRYQTFAQSFPNTVPFSEGIGFIAKVDEDDVDYVFHTTAHEVAHQWWGHQVVGGRVQGSALLSESVSEYAALMVMEKEYGFEGVKKFLRYELDGYLTGRAGERKKEVPLVRMQAHQAYLRYNKGALALYALRDYIGEARLNQALREYLETVRYQGPPYTNSLAFVEHLRAATPDSLRYVVSDLFEHVTLYENRADSATFVRLPGGRYQVDLVIQARKVRADSLGNQTDTPMADWVDVGVFAAEDDAAEDRLGAPLYLEKHKLRAGRQAIRVVVDREPSRAGVDPLHRLIDRQMSDNTVAVRER